MSRKNNILNRVAFSAQPKYQRSFACVLDWLSRGCCIMKVLENVWPHVLEHTWHFVHENVLFPSTTLSWFEHGVPKHENLITPIPIRDDAMSGTFNVPCGRWYRCRYQLRERPRGKHTTYSTLVCVHFWMCEDKRWRARTFLLTDLSYFHTFTPVLKFA